MKGSFRKRGKTWTFVVDIGKDPLTGKRKQYSKGGFRIKKDAEKACAEFISSYHNGECVINDKMTVKEFMTMYLTHIEVKVQKGTYKNYSNVIHSRIIPQLGNIRLQDFRAHHAQMFMNDLTTEGLSPKYIGYIKMILKGAFRYAVDNDQLRKNPMDKVLIKQPRRITYNTWTITELQTFITSAKQSLSFYHYISCLIAAHTGMRRGEVLGLRWSAVDLVNKRISVKETYSQTDKGFEFKDLKTSSSFRLIAIDELLVKELKEHKRMQNEWKLKLGRSYHDLDLVCCREDGQPMSPENLLRVFKSHVEKLGLPKMRFHDLRHTHATILLSLRENPKIVSERLGHSSVLRTLDTYSHVIPDMQEGTANTFLNALKDHNFDAM